MSQSLIRTPSQLSISMPSRFARMRLRIVIRSISTSSQAR
jgi:hypothetical protein